MSGKIVTTHAKAKAVRGEIEKFVTLAKKGNLNARRSVLASLDNAKDATFALFKKIVPMFANRQSGFTRIISLPRRTGDNAKMVRIEWTEKVVISDKPVATSKAVKPKSKTNG